MEKSVIDYTDFNKNILVQDKKGNCYRLRIEQDEICNSPRDWDNLGHMVCWHRDYKLGDQHNFSEPRDFPQELLFSEYSGGRARNNPVFEFLKSGKAKDARLEYNRSTREWELKENHYWTSKSDWRVSSSYAASLKDKVPDWFLDDCLSALSTGELLSLVKQMKGMAILPLYLYDHSGITMKTGGFSCPWDSGQVGWIYAAKEDIQKAYGAFTKENLQKAYQCLEGEVETYAQFLEGNVYWYCLEKFLGGTVGTESVTPEDAIEDDCFWGMEDSCGGFYGSDVNENGMADCWGDIERVD